MWPKNTTILDSVEKTVFSRSLEKYTHSFLPLFRKQPVECLLCALWCTGNRHTWEQTGKSPPPQCYHSELTENEPTKKLYIVTMVERILAKCQSRQVWEQKWVGTSQDSMRTCHWNLLLKGDNQHIGKKPSWGSGDLELTGTLLTGMRCPSLGESPFSLVTSHSCRGTMCVPKLSLTSQLKNNSHMKKTVRNDMIVLPTGSSQKLS